MAEIRTVARPYARAAFQKALASNALDSWSDALEQLGKVALNSNIAAYIAAPAATAKSKADKLAEICSEHLNGEQKNFIAVLAENNRLSLLPEIHSVFEALKAEQESNVQVVLTTAYPLDGSAEEKITSALKSKLNSDVTVETAVDASLLGGALIKVGDSVIDGSVKGRLAKLATAMNS